MPRRPDIACNRCGELIWRGITSLPEGQARCRPCRRIEPMRVKHLAMCAWCWQVFTLSCKSRKFCSSACYGKSNQIRTDDDPHQERKDREKNAPGLSNHERRQLLTQWKRQGTTCAYCDAPPTTVDHVLPLIRGGTNHEGNLVPCCKRCNSSKGGLTVVEWRTGKRLPRMGRALAWQNRVRVVKAPRVKPPKPEPMLTPCRICETPTVNKTCCSDACRVEANRRSNRDIYRARVGLSVDPSQPTSKWLKLVA